MADDGETAARAEMLFGEIAAVLERAHDVAVSALPKDDRARLRQFRQLKQAGADVVALADACAVLLRSR